MTRAGLGPLKRHVLQSIARMLLSNAHHFLIYFVLVWDKLLIRNLNKLHKYHNVRSLFQVLSIYSE